MTKYIIAFGMILLFLTSIADDKAGEEINWQVISGGGQINGVSTNYKLSSTVAQTATGYGSSTSYGLSHGFWQEFTSGSSNCCNVAGDANNDVLVNLLDITFLINYLYNNGTSPVCMYEADNNGNCQVNLLDITNLINFLYKSGTAPLCASDCGW